MIRFGQYLGSWFARSLGQRGAGSVDPLVLSIRAKLGGYWTFNQESPGVPTLVTRLDSLGLNHLTDIVGCPSIAGVSPNTGLAARTADSNDSFFRKLSPVGIVGNVNHEWFGSVRFLSTPAANPSLGFIANQMRLRWNSNVGNVFRYDIYDGGANIRATANSAVTVSLNTWYFIRCGLMTGGDFGTAFISVNGETVATTPLSAAAGTNANRLDFGNLAGANICEADWDDWGYVLGNLTVAEAAFVYNGGLRRVIFP